MTSEKERINELKASAYDLIVEIEKLGDSNWNADQVRYLQRHLAVIEARINQVENEK